MSQPILQAILLRAGNTPGVPLHEPLDFDLCAGERIAVVGASGAGKTTLLRTMAGLQSPLTGTTLLQGKTPDEWGWSEYRSKVIPVSQRPALLATSAEENLRRPFQYKANKAKTYSRERAAALMERLGLQSSQLDQIATILSVGEQQRLCLIRALLLDPDALCLDEPSSALDSDSTTAVESSIAEESARTGLCALIVMHNPKQASRLCSKRIEVQRAAVSGADARSSADAEGGS